MEPDRLAAALARLDREALARLSRSLAWDAHRSRQRGRPARAAWQDVLRDLVDDELAAREGFACPVGSPLRCVRRACRDLPPRDRSLLAYQYGAQYHDVEGHALRPVAGLYALLCAELRHSEKAAVAPAGNTTIPLRRHASVKGISR